MSTTDDLTTAPAPQAPRKRTPLWRLLLGWLLVLLSFPVAILGAAFALLGVCYLTGWRFAQEAIPLISLFALVAGGTWLGMGVARHPRRWRQWIALVLGAVTAAVIGAPGATIFEPVASPAELTAIARPSPNVRYWNLPTGSRIAYRKFVAAGRPKPTPILLLHGGPGGAWDFIGNGTRSAVPGYDCYFYDQVGCGFSSRLADVRQYTVDRHVADLEAIRQQIGADQIVVCGWSWGATLAASYLAAHPDHVARVVLSSPGEMEEADLNVKAPASVGIPTTDGADERTSGGKANGSGKRDTPTAGDGSGNSRPRESPKETHPSESARSASQVVNIAPSSTKAEAQRLVSLLRACVASGLMQLSPTAAHNFLPDREADPYMGRLLALSEGTLPVKDPASGPAPLLHAGFWCNQMTNQDLRQRTGNVHARLRSVRVPVIILRPEHDYLPPAIASDYRATLPDCILLHVENQSHLGMGLNQTWLTTSAFLSGDLDFILGTEAHKHLRKQGLSGFQPDGYAKLTQDSHGPHVLVTETRN